MNGRILAGVVAAACLAAIAFAIGTGGGDGPVASVTPVAAETTHPDAGTPLAQDGEGRVSGYPAVAAAELTEPPVLAESTLDLVDLDGWLQGSQAAFDGIGDRPATVVQFWTFGCHNCKATLPCLIDVYDTFGPAGVEIIGVHSPEFSYEADPGAIPEAADELGVTWPIALDTSLVNFWDWQEGRTNYWPLTYVVDRQGRIRFDEIGEGGYERLADTLAWLLADEALEDRPA